MEILVFLSYWLKVFEILRYQISCNSFFVLRIIWYRIQILYSTFRRNWFSNLTYLPQQLSRSDLYGLYVNQRFSWTIFCNSFRERRNSVHDYSCLLVQCLKFDIFKKVYCFFSTFKVVFQFSIWAFRLSTIWCHLMIFWLLEKINEAELNYGWILASK